MQFEKRTWELTGSFWGRQPGERERLEVQLQEGRGAFSTWRRLHWLGARVSVTVWHLHHVFDLVE
jgi:hypothetical protein